MGKTTFAKVKSYEEACRMIDARGATTGLLDAPSVAAKKLKVIAQAVNGGWEPDWDDMFQLKFFPAFSIERKRLVFSAVHSTIGITPVQENGLYFGTRGAAEYMGRTFSGLYSQLVFGRQGMPDGWHGAAAKKQAVEAEATDKHLNGKTGIMGTKVTKGGAAWLEVGKEEAFALYGLGREVYRACGDGTMAVARTEWDILAHGGGFWLEAGHVKDMLPACPKCGKRLVPGESRGYAWKCYGCDENFYSFEI